MAYPKPLSEKSLARLYQQSGLSQELYSEEKRADLSREIVSKALVGFGYGRRAAITA